jgi:NADH-quinone oxidoreductase subunit F
MLKVRVLGDVNCRGSYSIDGSTTLKKLLINNAEGMKNGRKLLMVQTGGVLGTFYGLDCLNIPIEEIEKKDEELKILYLNDLFCPVDYVKFIMRYCINTMKKSCKNLLEMREIAEELVGEEGTENGFQKLRELTMEPSKDFEEKRIKDIVWEMTEKYYDIFLEHVKDKRCRTTMCRRLYSAQCINECPAGVNIPGYIELMEHGKVEDAYKLMKQSNPLSFICGKICARPCEDRCRRGELEQSVGVRALKRYASDMALKLGQFPEDSLEKNGRSVAIIGGGPAGLSSAYYLARSGYKVTIFEANKVAGGMLAAGIPEYRLPQATIDTEVEYIKRLGVEIKTGVKVGKDIDLAEIRRKYDGVLLATGCQIGNAFANGAGIETAVKFLKEVKLEGRKNIGRRVLVIGGGDVAMDAARTSLRLGAEKVFVATLEGSVEEMPASFEEKKEALEEGIELLNGYSAKDIYKTEENRLEGISLKRCLSVWDDEYKFAPVYDEEDTLELELDSLIFAIGQRPDNGYFTEEIEVDERGWIKINPVTFETSVQGVFAAGDMSRAGTAIKAISEGKKSAEAIDRHLKGKGIYTGEEVTIPEIPLNLDIWNTEKVEEGITAPQERINFDESARTFTEEEARCEARRCMRCDRNSRKRY